MFYRRKILLALLEAFGGSLSKNDCQKLLFLFCRRRGKNYYDFFPSEYGSTSMILAQDKERLANLEYLIPQDDFYLKDNQQLYVNLLEKNDQQFLYAFVEEMGNLRGEALLHKAYLEAPHYASHSQITKQILSPDEYQKMSSFWNKAKSPCLFTIGYEGLSIDAYLDLLIANNVVALVDVRKNPLSMKYGFSKTKLATYTKLAGILYIHLPDLGISSALRQELKSMKDYQNLFDFYAAEILPAHGAALDRLKSFVNEYGRVAITCFEADYHFCHRHKVAEYLEHDPDFNTSIIHVYKDYSGLSRKKDKEEQNGILEENTLYLPV